VWVLFVVVVVSFDITVLILVLLLLLFVYMLLLQFLHQIDQKAMSSTESVKNMMLLFMIWEE